MKKFKSITFATVITWLLLFGLKSSEAQIKPEEIIEKSLEAQGGRKYLESIKDTLVSSTIKAHTPRGEFLIEQKVYLKKEPLRIRIEQSLSGIEIITGFDGEKVWISQMGRTMVAPQFYTDSIKASLSREDLLLKYKEKGCKIEFLGSGEINGQTVYNIKFIDKEGEETLYFFDSKKYLPLKVVFSAPDETGKITQNEVVNSDFRNVEGILMPFKIETYKEGKKSAETVIKEVKINQGLEDTIFIMPEKK